MTHKPTAIQRLRYAFDNTLSHGPASLILWLAAATVIIIALAIGVDLALGGISDQQGLGPREVVWTILFQALVPNPPGNFDSPFQFLVVMMLVTLASLVMVSILIGLLSATIQERIETLRRGRSQVVETGHTVILGWSEQVFPIVSELVLANANRRRACIAILGEADKVEMEEELHRRLKATGHTRIVVRRGSPTQHADLDLVSPQTSKSIIILPEQDSQLPDAATIKAVLALVKAPDRRPDPYHIVAVLQKLRNQEVARLVGGDELELVLSGDVIARIMAQTSRQAGLSMVYSELMDFEGDEIYFTAEPTLVGKTFGDALLAYEDSAVIGIEPRGEPPILNPSGDTLIREGDRIIAISQDDDAVRVSGLLQPPIQTDAIASRRSENRAPERTLLLGWNWRANTVIRQLDAYVSPGSLVSVVAQHETVQSEVDTLGRELVNQQLEYQPGDISSRAVLDRIHLEAYDHIILLSYSDTLDNQRADALTLLTLFHLRRIADERNHTFSLVSEIKDLRNRELAETARADDFIVSDQFISLIMAQISENPHLNAIFNDLLDPQGTEIDLKPAADYIPLNVPVSFYTVIESAKQYNELAIGYRLKSLETDRQRGYGVKVNPPKSVPITFAPGDRIIVLANR